MLRGKTRLGIHLNISSAGTVRWSLKYLTSPFSDDLNAASRSDFFNHDGIGALMYSAPFIFLRCFAAFAQAPKPFWRPPGGFPSLPDLSASASFSASFTLFCAHKAPFL